MELFSLFGHEKKHSSFFTINKNAIFRNYYNLNFTGKDFLRILCPVMYFNIFQNDIRIVCHTLVVVVASSQDL